MPANQKLNPLKQFRKNSSPSELDRCLDLQTSPAMTVSSFDDMFQSVNAPSMNADSIKWLKDQVKQIPEELRVL